MPYTPKQPCSQPGCPALVAHGRCDAHKAAARKSYDRERRDPTARRFYSSAMWLRARESQLNREPLCAVCRRNGITTSATLVHHRDGDVWNLKPENLQSLCIACHSTLEDLIRGGFDPKPKATPGGVKRYDSRPPPDRARTSLKDCTVSRNFHRAWMWAIEDL